MPIHRSQSYKASATHPGCGSNKTPKPNETKERTDGHVQVFQEFESSWGETEQSEGKGHDNCQDQSDKTASPVSNIRSWKIVLHPQFLNHLPRRLMLSPCR